MQRITLQFEGPVIEWRGPAPFYFVAIPQDESDEIKDMAKGIEYWGQVPVTARSGASNLRPHCSPRTVAISCR